MAKKIKEEVIDLGNGIELTMVLIPKGKFLMGWYAQLIRCLPERC